MVEQSTTPTTSKTRALQEGARHFLAPLGAALSFGVVAHRRGHRGLALVQFLVTLTVIGGLLAIVMTGYWVDIALSPKRLVMAIVVVLAASIAAGVSAIVEWLDRGAARTGRATVWAGGAGLVIALFAVAAPAAAACYVMVPQIRVAEDTFVSAPVAVPHPLEPSESDASATTASTTSTTVTSSGSTASTVISTSASAAPARTTPVETIGLAAEHQRLNVLLLGGDAGPGRWNLRTDSVNLVSIDLATGDAAIIGIPRNLGNAPLPPGPLRERFPKGFDDLFNALYPWGDQHPTAVQEALGPTDNPGASLVAASAAEFLGVQIDAWVLVDMAGFIDVIDALGGLDVYVPKTIRAPGNPPTAKHPVKARIEIGWHRMDGTDALSFARTRYDSDYARMARQRCLLASLAAQKSPSDVALHWIGLSAVIADRVQTNLTASQLRLLLGLAGSSVHGDRVVALTPPLVKEAGWHGDEVRQIVADAIAGTGAYDTETTADGVAPTYGMSLVGEVCVTHQ